MLHVRDSVLRTLSLMGRVIEMILVGKCCLYRRYPTVPRAFEVMSNLWLEDVIDLFLKKLI